MAAKKILLIDADSTIPNLPLMKLSTWHKGHGDRVQIERCRLPFGAKQNRKKRNHFFYFYEYDKAYCSVVFDGNARYIHGDNIIFGGTGFDLKTNLPEEIESLAPDYSLYPDNDISYGFITRGCIRKCSFCKVPEKEGGIHKVADWRDIVKHKKVKFLDNNFLAYEGHKEILQELVDNKIRCQFNQGLDIRLIDKENSRLLSEIKCLGNHTFSFDSWAYRDLIERKLELLSLLSWSDRFIFFLYIHPDMPLSDTVRRIVFLREREKRLLPYPMRDETCYTSMYKDFYTAIVGYCSNFAIFAKASFPQYVEKYVRSKQKRDRLIALWNENQ